MNVEIYPRLFRSVFDGMRGALLYKRLQKLQIWFHGVIHTDQT